MLNTDAPRAACADRLDLVDAAYARPGISGQESKAVADLKRLCRTCPIAEACLTEAMLRREYGVWGGTTPYMRTTHGAAGCKSTQAQRRAS